MEDRLDLFRVLQLRDGIFLETPAREIFRNDNARFAHPVGLFACHAVNLRNRRDGKSVGAHVVEVVIVAVANRVISKFFDFRVQPWDGGETVRTDELAEEVAVVVYEDRVFDMEFR